MKIYVAFTYSEPEKFMGVGDMITEVETFPLTMDDIENIKSLITRVCPKTRSKAVITSMFELR